MYTSEPILGNFCNFQICVWRIHVRKTKKNYAKHKNAHIRTHFRRFQYFSNFVWRIRETKPFTRNIKMYTSKSVSGFFALGIGGECHIEQNKV